MSEVMFYCGSVFSIFLFIVSVLYFFKAHIIEAFRYYFKIQKGAKRDNKIKMRKTNSVSSADVTRNKDIMEGETNLLENETDIISAAENYATTLLDAESSTELLNLDEDF